MRRHLAKGIPVILIAAVASWYWIQLRIEHGALVQARRAAVKSVAFLQGGSPDSKIAATKTGPGASSKTSQQLAALLLEIQTQENAIAQITREADDLTARLPDTSPDELLASFGRIEDMGRNAGSALRGLIRMLAGHSASGPENEANVIQLMRVKGQLPEIRNFENNPDEIARFQSSTLRQALDLSETTEAAMRPLIRNAFIEMAQQNLTASHRPLGPAEEEQWVVRRGQALQRLMHQLRPHLPDSNAPSTREALMFALNVGAGFDEKTTVAPGAATLAVGVTWPQVPW